MYSFSPIKKLNNEYAYFDETSYDICVITAANEYQAQGYRKQIEWRIENESLPKDTKYFVIADPNGYRVGSGGSTIYVLYKLSEYLFLENKGCQTPYELFKGKRILILHSGGDSKRIPAYSAVGKIFMPLPTEFSSLCQKKGCKSSVFISLFELMLGNFMLLPHLNEGQVVVASGDVLLSFDPSKISFNNIGITGLAYPENMEIASNHGVYIIPHHFGTENPKVVKDFLQKPSCDELESCNGFDPAKKALIDTGVMNFGIDTVKTVMDMSGISIKDDKISIEKDSLCESLINSKIQLDIYKEIPFAILGKKLQSNNHPSLDALLNTPFFVNILPYCEFFHLGSSKHLIQNFHTVNYTSSTYGFQNFNKSKIQDKTGITTAFVYNSIINTSSIYADGPCFIEGCHLDGNVLLEGENILTGILKTPDKIKLQHGICVTNIPINSSKNGWVSIIYGIDDNFKKTLDDNDATFLNRSFADWMKGKGIRISDLWDNGESHELWNARLFPFDGDASEAMRICLILQENDKDQIDEWRNFRRISLKEILEFVDYENFFSAYSDLCREVNLGNIADIIIQENDLTSDEVLAWCRENKDYQTVVENILSLIKNTDEKLLQARLYKLLGSILQKTPEIEWKDKGLKSISDYENIAFGLVRDSIGLGLKNKILFEKTINTKLEIRSDEVVWVCSPVRFDLAGGWSDTPPYCLEHGGSVLNTTAKLNGQYPIQVVGKIFHEPVIRINSIDLGSNMVISDMSDLMSFNNPEEWPSLPKSAFVASGIISQDENRDLRDIMKGFGGGIDLTLFSAVPSGSGLGTSSILGASIIACLSKMFKIANTPDDLFNRTLYMEQLMTTGGGWQDQIGAIIGGAKLIKTEPGLFQIPNISWTDIGKPDMILSDRFLLYYTGSRRMAKNILHSIVGKYLDRDKETIYLLAKNKDFAVEMKEILDRRDIDAFGEKIRDVWELQKKLDPGTSNENIESILEKVSDHFVGAKLLGAGGGGFLFMVTKGVEHSQKIKHILTKNPPNDRARFFDFEIDPNGLKINVL